jgi:hypothetical protein
MCVSREVLIACGRDVSPMPNDSNYLHDMPDGASHYITVLCDLRKAYQDPSSQVIDFRFLRDKTYLSRCTDERNLVYALLGLVRDGRG